MGAGPCEPSPSPGARPPLLRCTPCSAPTPSPPLLPCMLASSWSTSSGVSAAKEPWVWAAW